MATGNNVTHNLVQMPNQDEGDPDNILLVRQGGSMPGHFKPSPKISPTTYKELAAKFIFKTILIPQAEFAEENVVQARSEALLQIGVSVEALKKSTAAFDVFKNEYIKLQMGKESVKDYTARVGKLSTVIDEKFNDFLEKEKEAFLQALNSIDEKKRQELEEKSDKAKSLETKIAELTKQLEEKRKDLDNALSKQADLENELKVKISGLQTKLEETEQALQDTKAKLEEKRQELEEKSDKAKSLETKIAELTKQLEEKRKDLDNALSKQADLENELKVKISGLRTKLEETEQALQDTKAKLGNALWDKYAQSLKDNLEQPHHQFRTNLAKLDKNSSAYIAEHSNKKEEPFAVAEANGVPGDVAFDPKKSQYRADKKNFITVVERDKDGNPTKINFRDPADIPKAHAILAAAHGGNVPLKIVVPSSKKTYKNAVLDSICKSGLSIDKVQLCRRDGTQIPIPPEEIEKWKQKAAKSEAEMRAKFSQIEEAKEAKEAEEKKQVKTVNVIQSHGK